MKIKLLMIGLLGLISTTTFGQKGMLNNAQTDYDEYVVSTSSGQKLPILIAKAKTSLNSAKTEIDKASANEKTSGLAQTYALKAAIYASIALGDSVQSVAATDYNTASDALKQAKTLDTKNENTKMINHATIELSQFEINKGVKEFQDKKFEDAYKSFETYRELSPEDTTAILYTALSATNAAEKDPKYYPVAITNYNKLVTTGYSKKAQVYMDMSLLYLRAKDTTGALKAATEGVAKYPSNSELRKREIEIALQSGKQNDVLTKIQGALANDPKNKTLYYYAGLTYSQVADAANNSSEKAKDAASKASQHQIALENYSKAADMYKKAIEIDPEYFEANLNLGYVLMRPAIDAYYAAAKLPSNQQKQYEAALDKANAQFDLAKPYLQKAVDMKPNSIDALSNLRSYYRGKTDKAHAAEYAAKAAELKKQIDALSAQGGK